VGKSTTSKRERAISAPPVKRKRAKNDNVRRSFSTGQGMWVQGMTYEKADKLADYLQGRELLWESNLREKGKE
jgi:hypothetical protein